MPLERTALDQGRLSEAARKALVPGPGRMMAARGMAPLPPVDMASVLYELARDSAGLIADAARKTAGELPDRLLQGVLGDPALDPRVLDWLAGFVVGKPALIELVLLNPSAADATIADLAGKLDQREVDIIATNEQRLLRCPDIIGAMYMNRRARMSTVDRAVELAVRNQLKVPGVPAWEEVVAAVLGTKKAAADAPVAEVPAAEADAEIDAALQAADKGDEDRTVAETQIHKMSVPMKVRLATLGNRFQRSVLIRDPSKLVAVAAIKAPGVTEMDAARYAVNHSLPDEVISYIAGRREWTKLYGVKLSLVQNPKCPIPSALRMMADLRENDLKNIARSKGISAAVAAGARKRLLDIQQRGKK
jgi:hypothetical protein